MSLVKIYPIYHALYGLVEWCITIPRHQRSACGRSFLGLRGDESDASGHAGNQEGASAPILGFAARHVQPRGCRVGWPPCSVRERMDAAYAALVAAWTSWAKRRSATEAIG